MNRTRVGLAPIQNLKNSSLIRWPVWRLACWCLLGLAAAANPALAGVINVPAGGNLQAAINAAQPGDVIQLQPAATFTGNFLLPAKPGSQFITIRTALEGTALPGPDTRIDPQVEPLLATLRSNNGVPVLRTAPGAHHWLITVVRFVGGGGNVDVIQLGSGATSQNDYNVVPQNLVLDHVIIRGAPNGQKRGIALNSGTTTIRNSYITDIVLTSQETHAIAGWNGPGPYLIENNHLEAAGVNVLFGGAEPYIAGLVPSDIVVRRNLITKKLAWRSLPQVAKNLFELKNARRVLVEGNTLENNWADAQSGYAVLFTVRASGTRASWSTVEDVRFQNNVVRRSGSGINILGLDIVPSQRAHGIVIRNNLFSEIDHAAWGGGGTFVQAGDEPADITIDHNTVIQTGNVATVYGGTAAAPRPITGFRLTNNITIHNQYGLFGAGHGTGNGAIAAYLPGAVVTANVMAGGNANLYPAGNLFPSVSQLMAHFVNAAGGDYRLVPSSSYRGRGTDGRDLGVDFAELNAALAGVICDPAHPVPPPAPTGHVVQTSGTTLVVSWQPAPSATSYVLEAGSAPGLTNIFNANIGNVTSLGSPAPAGPYYTRVRSVSACGVSAPSNEVFFQLGSGGGLAPCTAPPAAPTGHAVQTLDLHALLSWNPSPTAASYFIEAGSGPGLANLAVFGVGAVTSFVGTAPAGSYVTRVRGVNGCGVSAPSNEVAFSLGCSGAPEPPAGLTVLRSGTLILLTWSASPRAAAYVLQAGTAPGASNALNASVGGATNIQFDSRGVPPGTYYVRVLASNACGTSGAASEVAVSVP
jgi:hypothetical protein